MLAVRPEIKLVRSSSESREWGCNQSPPIAPSFFLQEHGAKLKSHFLQEEGTVRRDQ